MSQPQATLPEAIFWDMDGTLMNTEPYWGQSEQRLFDMYGLEWKPELAARLQGGSLEYVSSEMQKAGLSLPTEEIVTQMVQYVMDRESEAIPWTEGVLDVLTSARDAGIPSMLVTGSPQWMAQNLISQAPEGVFAGFVCNDDPIPHKPEPDPYFLAAQKLGISKANMKNCLIFEDSIPGLTAAQRSGAVVVAVTDYSSNDNSDSGLQFATIPNFASVTVDWIADIMKQATEIGADNLL